MAQRRNHRSGEHGAALEESAARQAERNLAYYARHPDEIEERLRELDGEVGAERALLVAGGALSVLALLRALLGRRRWLFLPLAAQAFAIQHAIEGTCAPVELLRRIGLRSDHEIAGERQALLDLGRSSRRDDGEEMPARPAARRPRREARAEA